jgi:hypothetical protein
MCVKCRIWFKIYKIFLGGRGNNTPSGPRHFHLGYCFLIWASGLKISVAQLAIMHKKLIWDPAYVCVYVCLMTYVCVYICLMTYVCDHVFLMTYVCLTTYVCVYACLKTSVCVYICSMPYVWVYICLMRYVKITTVKPVLINSVF